MLVVADADVTVAMAADFDVVVVTSSVAPSVLGGRLANAAVPILVSEAYLFDDMGFVGAGKSREYGSQTTMRIVDPSHPLANGRSFDVPVFAAPTGLNIGFDSAAPGLIPIAVTNPGSTRLTLFGFETGADLVAGTAPAGRVGFFAPYGATLTTHGVGLLDAGVDWLLTQPGTGSLDPDHDGIPTAADNCPWVLNMIQFDTDGDGLGDECDPTPTAPSTGSFVMGPALGSGGLAGDIDNDGRVDVVSATTVWHNIGGAFVSSDTGFAASTVTVLADIDHDGFLDLYVGLNIDDDQPGGWHLNDGTGAFGATTDATWDEIVWVTVGDFDGDGVLDPRRVDGQNVYESGFVGEVAGDLDGDLDLDLLEAYDHFRSGAILPSEVHPSPNAVALNDGTGHFTRSELAGAATYTTGVAIADLDGNGSLDLFETNGPKPVWAESADVDPASRVFVNDGAAMFTGTGQALGGASSGQAALGDVDGDGDVDAVTPAGEVWYNNGAAHFMLGQTLVPGGQPHLADLDGDGDLDALLGGRIWWNSDEPSGQPPAAMMIAGNSTPPSGDLVIVERVEAAGYDLMVIDDDSDLEALDLTGVDVLLISSSVVPSKVGDTFKDAALPIITWEGFLFDDMALSASGETSATHVAITIVDATSPLAAGLTLGNKTVYTTANRLNYGRPAADAIVVAREPGSANRAVEFAYAAGGELIDGSFAAGPRVAFFPTYDGAKRLTANGRALFDAALAWVGSVAANPTFEMTLQGGGP